LRDVLPAWWSKLWVDASPLLENTLELMERSAQQVLAQIVTVFRKANNTSKVCTDGVASLKNKNKGLFFFAISNRVAWLELQDADADNRIQSGPLGGGADDVAVTMSAWGSTTSRAMSPPPHPTLFDSFEYQLLPTEEAMGEGGGGCG